MKSYQSLYSRAKSFFAAPFGFHLIAILFIVLAIFVRIVSYDFFVFDDEFHILRNEKIQSNAISGLAWIWSHSMMPVTYTVWSAVGNLTNFMNPLPFHVLSLVLHTINCWLLYILLRNFFNYFWKDARSSGVIQKAAFLGTALFAVHPAHVENIAWVSAAKDLLSAMFFLLAFNYYWKTRITKPSPNIENCIVTFALITLSVLSKPTTLIAPLLLLTLDFVIFQYSFKRLVKIYGAFIVICILGYLNLSYLIPDTTIEYSPSLPWRFVVALNTFKVNFYKIILPFNYSFDYGHSAINIIRNAQASALLILKDITFFVVLTGLAVIFKDRRHNKVYFLSFIFLLILSIPSLGFIPFSFQTISTVADRYLYLPSIAAAIFLGAVYLNYEQKKKSLIAIYLVLILFGTVAYRTTSYWKNSITLLEYSLKKNPDSYYVRIALAQAYENDGQAERALQIRKAAEIYRGM